MSYKTIEYTVYDDKIIPNTLQSGGVAGDDNAVRVKFNLNNITLAADDKVRIEISNGVGGFNSSEHLTVADGCVYYDLPFDVTSAGGTAVLHLVICSCKDNVEQYVRYSYPAKIYFEESSCLELSYNQYKQGLSGLALECKSQADIAQAAADEADSAISTHNTDNNAHSNIQSRLTDYTDYAVSRHNTSTAAHEDIRKKIADDISAHNTDNNAHEGPFNSLRTFVIGVNGGLSSAKDKLNLLQKYPCYEYTASGGAVQRFDDVSVIEHNIGVTVHGATDENGNSVTTPTVKVYGKNLFSLSEGESGNGFTFSGSNCKIVNPTSYYYTLNSTDRIKLPKGTYTFTANVSGSIDYGSANILLFSYPVCGSTKTLLINKSEFESGTRIFTNTFTAEEAFEFYIERVSFDDRTPTSADLSIDLQLEVGDTMTDYEPYTEPQTATLPTALPAGQNGEIANTFYAVSPTMTVIASDDNNLIDTVDVTYNRDIGKAIAAITS